MKKIIALLASAALMLSAAGIAAYAEPQAEELYDTAHAFASQYPYKEGDVEKALASGFAEKYTSGIEKTADGVEYECPALYIDEHAALAGNFDLKMGEMSLLVNGKPSAYGQKCVLHNDATLVPVEVFDELGCERTYNEAYYLTTLKKNGTTLEIIPYMIGMRKNQADGYYVPLGNCARYVEGQLYVPIRVIAEELGLTVDWNGESRSVTIDG